MKEQLINVKSKAKMMAYLLLILAIVSGMVLGTRVLPAISFGAEDTQKLLVEANLEKYINYSISDQNKGMLVQYNVKEKMEYGENYIPIKNSEVEVQLSKIDGKYPYAVKTITKSTEVTNGKTTGMEENCQYDANTGKVTLRANNQNEQGELIYQDQPSQNAVDEYIILCYYDAYTDENKTRDLALNISAKSTLSTKENRMINANTTFESQVTENIGTLTSIDYQTEDIYNGYIKSNKINGTDYNTQYKETEQILVSKKEAQEKLEVLENNTFINVSQNRVGEEITTDLGNNNKLVYKSIKIAKESLVNLLGEDGVFEILDVDRNVIATINKDTQFDDDGTITINYENEQENIILRTSEIKNEGILTVGHIKEIKSSMTDVTNTKIKTTAQITGINEETVKTEIKDDETGKTQEKEEKIEKQVYVDNYENIANFQDAKTNVNINVSNTEWTNKQQNEITFDISLNANTIKDNMFRNPSLRIELPSEVEKVIIQNSGVFYANGLELQAPYLETNENGNIVIVANLTGAQTAYSGNALELTTDVRITATIILKKDIETAQANANLIYTNQYTLDRSTESGSQAVALQIESYKEEQTATIAEEKVETYNLGSTAQAKVEGLKLEVAPVKGEANIADRDTVYEGEYIKYNVKVTNTSDETMNDVTIVGGVPEGTTYGELVAEYYKSEGDYKYDFDTTVQSKKIEVGTIKPGESITKFYEVQVNDLAEGQDEKEITTNINAYVGKAQAASYEITNLVKPAEAKIFLGCVVGTSPNQWLYEVTVSSDESRETTVNLKTPELFELDYITILGQGVRLNLEDIANVSEDNIITLKINTNQTYIIGGYINSSSLLQETEETEFELVATADVKLNDITYQSNENRIVVGQLGASISITSNNEGEEVKYGDEIDYEITITNTGRLNIDDPTYLSISVNITDFLPENVKPISMTYNNWEEKREYVYEDEKIVGYKSTGSYKELEKTEEDISGIVADSDGNKLSNVDLHLLIPYGKSVNINVKATAGLVYEKTKVENSATVTGTNITAKTSNIITHTILPYNYEEISSDPENPDNPENPENPSNPEKPNTPEDPSNPSNPTDSNEKYSISGVAWLDENEDGQRQTSEKLLSGITAMVVDTKNATIVKDKVQTSSDGTYRFSDLDKGNYVVLFQYDTNTYRVTEYQKNGVTSNSNSDAITKEVTLNGETMKVGVIEVSNLEASISNMDIGLIENKICDFKLDKSITKVTVTTNNGTKQYSYNNEKLAKIEIRAKEIEGATVVVEYKIVVTNEGELASTVGKVIDYLPEGLTFSSELNKNWSSGANGQLINTSLSNQKIEAGESVELTLVATKAMTSNSTGTFTNAAEIGDITNSLGILDTDSTPGNKVKTEDDYSEAAVIISVSTGIFVYISIGLLLAVLVAVAVFLAYKYGILKIGKISLFATILVVTLIAGTGNADAVAKQAYFTPDYYGTRGHYNAYGPDWFFGSTESVGDGMCSNPGLGWHEGMYNYKTTAGVSNSNTTITEDDIDFTMENDSTKVVEMHATEDNYIFGPFEFKCTYDGGYKLEVKDGNGKEIKDYTIYDGNKNKITKLSGTGNIKFYLIIPASSCSNGISQVRVSTSRTGKRTTTTKYYEKVIYDGGSDQDVITEKVFLIDEKETEEEISKSKYVEWVYFNGCLEIEKIDADTGEPLEGVVFSVKDSSGKYVIQNKATDEDGKIFIDNLEIGKYTVIEESNPNYAYTLRISDTTKELKSGNVLIITRENPKQSGNLHIEKKDKDSKEPLEGISFKIKNSNNEYIIVEDANSSYKGKEVTKTITLTNQTTTQNADEATTFTTDSNGEINIINMLTGNYYLEEVSVGDNSGYEVDDETISYEVDGKEVEGNNIPFTVTRQSTDETEATQNITYKNKLNVYNERRYINLSGYVWVDMVDAKTTERNDLYKDKESLKTATGEPLADTKDLLLNGITVKLKNNKTGETVAETVTSQLNRYTDNGNDGNGEYLFEKVLIKELENYYIEFEYDGLTYTNVIPHIEKDNGSKAAESDSDRTTFNEKFSVVEGESRTTGYTRDAKGNRAYDLKYDKDGRETTLISDGNYEIKTDNNGNEYMQQNSIGNYPITANTTITKYSIKDQYEKDKTQDEIRYINLGLCEREQPDISLEKDLYSAKVSVNGYDHVYLYNSYYTNMFKEPNSNVGVEWGYEDLRSGNKVSYTRAVYKSDYEYENANDKSKELKVYITYELKMINQSDNLISKINSIVDYYDKRYTDNISIGTSVDNNSGTVTGNSIDYDIDKNYDVSGYKKMTIKNETKVDAQKSESIYVQFELTREAVADILHDKNVGEAADELLENVAEINSYSTSYMDGDKERTYAGVDKDSNPGNCDVSNANEFEDDTFACPALQLEVAAEREMTGTVFVDKALGSNPEELMTGEIRQGNGQYDEGEATVGEVEVTLTENTGSGKVYTAKTDNDGNFTIKDYIPGDYTLTYTWGDETYTVQDYKGTVYDKTRYDSNQNNKEWYKEETRYTDAIDNYDTDQEAPKGSRLQIDEEMASNTELTRTKMDSTTPTMGISVEYDTIPTDGNEDQVTFVIRNIDFGIIERARQVLEASKNVTGVKITLANGQVIVDAKIVDGKLEGTSIQGVTYGPADSTTKGFVRTEMDNELIQGATIQIEYTVTVANKSEIDYASKEYYIYGLQTGDIITQQPTGVYDYLDSEMVLDENNDNGNWKVVSREDYENEYQTKTMVESYFESKSTRAEDDGTTIEEYKWSTSQTRYQRIFTEWATEITEERTVRDNKLENKTILENADLEKELEPGKDNTVKLYTSKILSNTDEIDLNNDLEVTETKRVQTTGRIPNVRTSYLYDQGERVTVTPPTGDDQNYIPYIILGITSFIILAAGVVIIKRKII